MSNNSNGFNNNAYHDSYCEGPYCNCDNRRYGYSPKSSSMDWLWVVAYGNRAYVSASWCDNNAHLVISLSNRL